MVRSNWKTFYVHVVRNIREFRYYDVTFVNVYRDYGGETWKGSDNLSTQQSPDIYRKRTRLTDRQSIRIWSNWSRYRRATTIFSETIFDTDRPFKTAVHAVRCIFHQPHVCDKRLPTFIYVSTYDIETFIRDYRNYLDKTRFRRLWKLRDVYR